MEARHIRGRPYKSSDIAEKNLLLTDKDTKKNQTCESFLKKLNSYPIVVQLVGKKLKPDRLEEQSPNLAEQLTKLRDNWQVRKLVMNNFWKWMNNLKDTSLKGKLQRSTWKVEKVLTSLIIREMQIKITHYTTLSWLIQEDQKCQLLERIWSN